MLEYASIFRFDEESDMKTIVMSGKKATRTLMYVFGIVLVLAIVTFVVWVYGAVSHYTYQDSLQMVRVYVKPCATAFLVQRPKKKGEKKQYYVPLSECAINQASKSSMSKRYFRSV